MAKSQVYLIASFTILWLFFFPVSVVADIRKVRIDTGDSGPLVFIDYFGFGGNGGGVLQLNATNISLSPEFSGKNLSRIGFFLSPKIILLGLDQECNLDNNTQIYIFDKLNGSTEFSILLPISGNHTYLVYFENCLYPHPQADATLILHVDMHNTDVNGQPIYLSKTDFDLTRMYVVFSSILLSMAAFWIFYIAISWSARKVHIIHLLLVLAPLGRAAGLILKVVRNSYILHTGCQLCARSYLLLFGSWVFTEMPLALVVTLVCTGWSLLKPRLQLKEWRLLFGVIVGGPIIYCGCILVDIYQESLTTMISYVCPDIYIYVPFVLWGNLVAAATEYSTDFLKEFGTTYGKASVSVKYIALFNSFFVYSFGYALVKVLFLLPLEVFTPYACVVPIAILNELLALAMYGIVAYKLRPELRSGFGQKIDHNVEKAAAKTLLNCGNPSLDSLRSIGF